METRFEALGAYLPATKVSTRDLIARMKFAPLFDLQEITGIRERRVHSQDPSRFEDSFALALSAAQDALSRSKYKGADLDVIISGSISRYKGGYVQYFEPTFALQLKRALGATHALHFDVSNACAGMMTGVQLLDRLIKSGLVKNGLVVSGECITPIAETAVGEISEPFDPQFGSLTVGDSGVAVVMDGQSSDADRIHYVELQTCSDYAQLCIGMPSSQQEGPALYTNNAEMHRKERVQMFPDFFGDFLKRRGTDFAAEKFDYVVQHQIGTRAISNFNRGIGTMLGVEMPASLSTVEELGNTASTSHFVVLRESFLKGTAQKGKKFLLVPAASGIVIGALAATITNLEVA